MILYLLITLYLYPQITISNGAELNEVFNWKYVEFAWPNEELKSQALLTESYIPDNNVPLALAVWKDKVFLTIPRWKSGVASTLNYVQIGENKSPLLTPYPSWSSNLLMKSVQSSEQNRDVNNINEDPLVSVFRVWVDSCDRLWVIDDGVDEVFGDAKRIVRRSLLIFDLNTDKLITRYYFKKSDTNQKAFLGNIIVDVSPGECDNAYAYIADMSGFGLIVYSLKNNDSWRIEHLYFYPDPLSGEFNVGGITAHWIDGVLGLALSEIKNDGSRILYFNALTSTTQFEVSTRVIKNQTWANNPSAFDDFKVTGNKGAHMQSTTNVYDEKTGIIFNTQVNKYGISCWKSSTLLNDASITLLTQNQETLEFPADIKMDDKRNIWVITNLLPKYLYGKHNKNNINIRILNINVDDAIKDTLCE